MQLVLDCAMVDQRGTVYARIHRPLPRECAYIGERVVDEIRNGCYWVPNFESPMDAVVRMISTREVRKKVLQYEAEHAGAQLADFLMDREGWNGIDRAASTNRHLEQHHGR